MEKIMANFNDKINCGTETEQIVAETAQESTDE